MAPILNQTPLAALSFEDRDGLHISVYYQDTEGNIRETFFNKARGWHKRPKDIVGNGKLNTGIAAISWDNGTQIRVYFLSPKNQVVERVYSGGAGGEWTDGALTKGETFIAAPYSKIAAVGFGSGLKELRVYYQDATNKVREIKLDVPKETWYDGTNNLPVAVPGTSISTMATTARPGQLLWVYYQLPDMKFVEWMMDPTDSWSLGGFTSQGTYAPGAYVSAVVWNNIEIRVVAINDANKMTVTSYTANAWKETTELQIAITNSAVAAITLPTTKDSIRVYYQPAGKLVGEKGSNNGGIDWLDMEEEIPVER